MAGRARKTDSTARPSELAALNHIRLSRNWSYQQLADDMARAGFPIPAKTFHALVLDEGKRPYDRTLYQIRQYLAVANLPALNVHELTVDGRDLPIHATSTGETCAKGQTR